MKYLNKLFSLGLVAISASPVVASLNTSNINSSLTSTQIVNDVKEEDNLRCTVTYIGKNCTSNKQAIVARCVDSNPKAINCKLRKIAHNELANVTLKSITGFEYTLPSETYAYVCSPDAPKTDAKGEQNQFHNNGINEAGVGVTCTLSTYANSTALTADPHVDTGLGEEMLNQVITPQASSARKAMEVAAQAFDKHGALESNIILAIDQNEAWLMEIYTGHQYCAVKLPDDKVCIAGNEFILNTLADLGISEANKENCIVSPGLLSTPQQYGFAQYDSSGIQDIYHLDLFKTYAKPLVEIDPTTGKEVDTDYSHMRTWRGYSLFDPSGAIAQSYGYNTKYAPFLTPRDSSGSVRTDMSIADVISVYRDQFDELIGKEGFERFTQAKAAGTLRTIACETNRSVHIMTANPNLPKEFAVNEWYCPSSGNYGPFILVNNGINSVEGEYGYWPERYTYDEYCSAVLYRKLNALAWPEREKYGYPIQRFWNTYEYVYSTQLEQVISDAANQYSISDAQNIITNFSKHVRDVHIQAIKDCITDLTWHDMAQSHETTKKEFVPLIDIQQYLTNLGWTDFKLDGNILTFKYGNNINGKLNIGEGYVYEKGDLVLGDKVVTLDVIYRDGRIFAGLDAINSILGDYANIIKINVNDYLDKPFNHWLWAGPLIGLVVLAGGITALILVKKNKKTKAKRK